MPEPNLPFLNLNDTRNGFNLDEIKKDMPELPEETRASLNNYDLHKARAETILVSVICERFPLAILFLIIYYYF